jgi:hypothetical protein
MPEVLTCGCGNQSGWEIQENCIICTKCGIKIPVFFLLNISRMNEVAKGCIQPLEVDPMYVKIIEKGLQDKQRKRKNTGRP